MGNVNGLNDLVTHDCVMFFCTILTISISVSCQHSYCPLWSICTTFPTHYISRYFWLLGSSWLVHPPHWNKVKIRKLQGRFNIKIGVKELSDLRFSTTPKQIAAFVTNYQRLTFKKLAHVRTGITGRTWYDAWNRLLPDFPRFKSSDFPRSESLPFNEPLLKVPSTNPVLDAMAK